MEEANKRQPNTVYAVSCHLYTQLCVHGVGAADHWIKVILYSYIIIVLQLQIIIHECDCSQENVFSFAKILIPVNVGCHWCLAVVDITECELRYGGGNTNC